MALCDLPNGECEPSCDFFALSQFITFANKSGFQLERGDFMFMGVIDGLHLYKHYDTRRYLNLDSSGHAFKYDGKRNEYSGYSSPVAAIEHVLS